MDADDELVAWQLANAEADGKLAIEKNRHHRCPPDMPPCPDCQQIDDDESKSLS